MPRRQPYHPSSSVTTSSEILDDRIEPTRVFCFENGDWMITSGFESEESQPILVHFSHLIDIYESLGALRLAKGEYALRARTRPEWHVFGPIDDATLDQLLSSGQIDEQQEALPH